MPINHTPNLRDNVSQVPRRHRQQLPLIPHQHHLQRITRRQLHRHHRRRPRPRINTHHNRHAEPPKNRTNTTRPTARASNAPDGPHPNPPRRIRHAATTADSSDPYSRGHCPHSPGRPRNSAAARRFSSDAPRPRPTGPSPRNRTEPDIRNHTPKHERANGWKKLRARAVKEPRTSRRCWCVCGGSLCGLVVLLGAVFVEVGAVFVEAEGVEDVCAFFGGDGGGVEVAGDGALLEAE